MSLNVGVLGCSKFADRAMIPAASDLGSLKITCIASRDLQKATRFAEKFNCRALANYDDLISSKDLDAIYIPLPSGVQYEWVKKALLNNKHVLVEKTFLGDSDKVKELVKIAREKKLLILENFLFLRHQQCIFIKECLRKNLIGQINLMRSSFCFPPLDDDNIRYNKSLGGGALLDAGTYIVKSINHFLSPKEILYVNWSFNHDEHRDIDISGSLTAHLDSKIFVQGYYSLNSQYQCSLEILGTEGKITAQRIFTAPPEHYAEVVITNKEQNKTYTFKDNQLKNQWEYFENLISGSQSFETEYNDLMKQSKLLNLLKDVNQHE